MLPLRTIGFLIGFFGLSAVSLVVPILGVVNYILVYQIFPEHAWWHLPIASLGIRYSMTAAVCMMFGMVLTASRMPPVRPALSFWDMATLCLVAVVGVSELTGLGPTLASGPLVDKFVKMILFVFCVTRIATTRRNFTLIMWALVVGCTYIGYDAWTAPRGAFAHGRLDGVGGPDFRHASGLAAHMAMFLPVIAVAFMTSKSWLLRLVTVIGGALSVNTIILCRTRSAFVGLACGAIAGMFLVPKKKRTKTYLAMAFGTLCAFALTDPAYWERMYTLRNKQTIEQDAAAMFRIRIWKSAMEIIDDHPWGIGIGNFAPVLAEVNPALGRRAAHNTFILCWTELGTQGIVLFVFIVGAALVQTRQCYWRAESTFDPTWTRYVSFGLFISIIVCIGTQMFTERLYTEAFWWVLALPGCLKRVVIREASIRENQWERVNHVDEESWAERNPLLPAGHARGAFA